MMNDMGHLRRGAGRAVRRTSAAVALAVLAAGCSQGDGPGDPDRTQPASAALRVQTVSGADQLDEGARAELEAAVGDVLSAYVVEAFLGDFPRQEFVASFQSFTSGVAASATRDIETLTAASARDATDVRATELDARLSFLTRGDTVHAGTATVRFAFEATMEDGSTRPLLLDGRIMLDAEGETWRIFGYDVRLDDGVAVDADLETEDGS